MRNGSKSVRFAVLWGTAFVVLSASAGDPPRDVPRRVDGGARENAQLRRIDPEKVVRDVQPMHYDLPATATRAKAEVTLAVRKGGRVLVSEMIALPNTVDGTATVSFLAYHDKELRQLRNLAKAAPDALRFTVSLGTDVIADVPFLAADGGSAAMAEGGEVIGSSVSVSMNMRPPRSVGVNGTYPDPACVETCSDAYYECMNVICDQRGDCSYCSEDYAYCEANCPRLCEEPKNVYEYGTAWAYYDSTGEFTCAQNWYKFIIWTDWDRRAVYERTVNCDDTYTDVFKRYEYRYAGMCKQFYSYGCIGNQTNLPPNC